MSAALADIAPGFADPVANAQHVFRRALEAMARPGRVFCVPDHATRGLVAEPASVAAASLLLALLDSETSVRLHGRLQALHPWLRFHTGVRTALPAVAAHFEGVRACDLTPAIWNSLDAGDDLTPEQSTTMVIDTAGDSVEPATGLRLRGPGIAHEERLSTHGLPIWFWQARIDAQRDYPRGIDIVLTRGARLLALPRSTSIQWET